MVKGELLNSAILLATNAHANQYDKGGVPYILHVLRVMYKLKTTDEELQCIAILHDTVEDTNITYQDLLDAGMTDRIVNGVKCLTKQKGETYEEYKQKVFSNVDSMLVKKSDLTHNSDIRRLKGVTQKDILRIEKYHNFYVEIQSRLNDQIS